MQNTSLPSFLLTLAMASGGGGWTWVTWPGREQRMSARAWESAWLTRPHSPVPMGSAREGSWGLTKLGLQAQQTQPGLADSRWVLRDRQVCCTRGTGRVQSSTSHGREGFWGVGCRSYSFFLPTWFILLFTIRPHDACSFRPKPDSRRHFLFVS
jgi:hypothetical protein